MITIHLWFFAGQGLFSDSVLPWRSTIASHAYIDLIRNTENFRKELIIPLTVFFHERVSTVESRATFNPIRN